jgi:hypothetical protein
MRSLSQAPRKSRQEEVRKTQNQKIRGKDSCDPSFVKSSKIKRLLFRVTQNTGDQISGKHEKQIDAAPACEKKPPYEHRPGRIAKNDPTTDQGRKISEVKSHNQENGKATNPVEGSHASSSAGSRQLRYDCIRRHGVLSRVRVTIKTNANG